MSAGSFRTASADPGRLTVAIAVTGGFNDQPYQAADCDAACASLGPRFPIDRMSRLQRFEAGTLYEQPARPAVAWITVALVVLLAASSPADTPNPARPALGINLAGPADWNTELPFVDVFRLSRAWISQREGAGWGKGPQLQLDEHGWVERLEPNCYAETPMCTIDGGHYPSGIWTVLWEGDGRIEFSKGKVVQSSPNRLLIDINSEGGGFFLRLRETNPKDPVRNIQVLMPGFTAEQAAANPWNPTFLERWTGIACLRFMDFQETNGSTQQHWSDRPKLSDATWTRHGVPVEMLCDLANRLKADAWFCVPHLADDDYVRQFAQVVGKQLDPQRRAWIEYSNEVWNGQFAQHRYAADQGQQAGLADKPWEAAWRYTAERSMQIFNIFEGEWKGRERLVRVLPSQAANPYVARQILSWNDAAQHADVLAIAPYISMNIHATGDGLTADDVSGWSVDRFLDYVEEHALPKTIQHMKENQQIATEHGLTLVCYEAGQHFVGVGAANQNEQLTKLLQQVNADARMASIYELYYAGWEQAGGGLLCHFSSVSAWGRYGSWGLLEYAEQPPASSPKFSATMKWAASLGQPVMKLDQTR
ncbi:MAG: hypothetical protein Fues2KO_01180 [Fuerstiella sp.]